MSLVDVGPATSSFFIQDLLYFAIASEVRTCHCDAARCTRVSGRAERQNGGAPGSKPKVIHTKGIRGGAQGSQIAQLSVYDQTQLRLLLSASVSLQ